MVDQIVMKTRVIFITHIHGDHQLGVLKMMHVRDELKPKDKLFVVTPSPMMKWMQLYVSDSLNHPEMVVLVPSENLNPEELYFYQEDHEDEDPEFTGE